MSKREISNWKMPYQKCSRGCPQKENHKGHSQWKISSVHPATIQQPLQQPGDDSEWDIRPLNNEARETTLAPILADLTELEAQTEQIKSNVHQVAALTDILSEVEANADGAKSFHNKVAPTLSLSLSLSFYSFSLHIKKFS